MAKDRIYIRSTTNFFINPYNFVTLPQKVERKKYEDSKLLTGELKCRITVKTPLAVPDVEKWKSDKEVPEHKIYPFNMIGNKHVIPGSSIRGMLRSLHETLTDSCFVTMADDEYVTARMNVKPFSPGVLSKNSNGDWELFKATRHLLPFYNTEFKVCNGKDGRTLIYRGNKYENGEIVYFERRCQKGDRGVRSFVQSIYKYNEKSQSKNNEKKGYIFLGEPIGSPQMKSGKKYESIFECTEDACVKISQKEIKDSLTRLDNVVEFYQNESINRETSKSHPWYENYHTAKRNGVIPLWFKEENGRIDFSMAAIGRKVYRNTVNDMVGEKRIPCSSREELCPSCSLFGMVKGDGFGSRVRITDAWEEKFISLGNVILKELGSPRTGYYPFYSSNGEEFDGKNVSIAGRKYYWHIPSAANSRLSYESVDTKDSKAKTERNATMELAGVGSVFDFSVFYDDISEVQLEQLIWTLTLGNNTESGNLMHKLGHGKPLGLGSVKIQVLDHVQRCFSIEKGYEKKTVNIENKDSVRGFSGECQKGISVILDFNAVNEFKCDVRYPYIELVGDIGSVGPNEIASHKWYSENKSIRKDAPKPLTLAPLGKNMLLPVMTYQSKSNISNFAKKEFVGKVSKIFYDRNYGFIDCEDGNNYYFHQKALKIEDFAKIKVGDKVSFTLGKGTNGKTAAFDVKVK